MTSIALSSAELEQARAALLGPSSDGLIEHMANLSLHRRPSGAPREGVELAVQLGWCGPSERFTPVGLLVGDSLREYRFWLERGLTTHGEKHHPFTSVRHYQGKDVLEIGCGFGANLYSISQMAKRAVGLEPVAVYRQLSPILGERSKMPTIELHDGFAERLPFGDASFDVVISYSSYEYTDIRATFKEAYRVLRKGGQLQLMSGTLQQFVHTTFREFKDSKSLGVLKYMVEGAVNTFGYDWLGRRITQPRVAGMTLQPVYPGIAAMRRMLLEAGLAPIDDFARPTGEDTLFFADKLR